MQTAKIRFLEKGEQPMLSKGANLLPKAAKKKYIEACKPYRLTAERDMLTAILQTDGETGMTQVWRKNAVRLLEQLKKDGIEIVIPPIQGELPREILPFAEGRRLANLFAFEGAVEALRRQGKHPEKCRYLLVGGSEDAWRVALTSMGNEVNHLSIFTPDPNGAKELTQELFEEWGLMTEIFSSPKNPVFSQADVVFCCGMELRAYEHMLGRGAVWIDLVGNRPALQRLREHRPDVSVMDGFFFKTEGIQMEGRFAEAEAYLSCPIFRENWQFPLERAARKEMLCELGEKGYMVSGFSVQEKRVKIKKNQGFSARND